MTTRRTSWLQREYGKLDSLMSVFIYRTESCEAWDVYSRHIKLCHVLMYHSPARTAVVTIDKHLFTLSNDDAAVQHATRGWLTRHKVEKSAIPTAF